MPNKAASFIVAAMLSLVLTYANANDTVFIYGLGQKTCAGYLEDRQQRDQQSYKGIAAQSYGHWFAGYASGWNVATKGQQLSIPEFTGTVFIAYMDKFCKDNPIKNVFAGADCLLREYKINTGGGFSCK